MCRRWRAAREWCRRWSLLRREELDLAFPGEIEDTSAWSVHLGAPFAQTTPQSDGGQEQENEASEESPQSDEAVDNCSLMSWWWLCVSSSNDSPYMG